MPTFKIPSPPAGKRFGELTVIEEMAPVKKPRHYGVFRYIRCRCDCGNVKAIKYHGLRNGRYVTCGHKRPPENDVWYSMIYRCDHPGAKDACYSHVDVCQRWRDSFWNFWADMGPKPSRQHSLDRIDSSGDYSPDNCRWATLEQQANNKRNSSWMIVDGEKIMVKDLAKKTGLGRHYLRLKARNQKKQGEVL